MLGGERCFLDLLILRVLTNVVGAIIAKAMAFRVP